jgi:hypothetical protein
MSDPLDALFIRQAKEIRRQEIDEIESDSHGRRRRILRALEAKRPLTLRERLINFLIEWRFTFGSALGASAMAVLVIVILPNDFTSSRQQSVDELQYSETLGSPLNDQLPKSVALPNTSARVYGNLIGALPRKKGGESSQRSELRVNTPTMITLEVDEPLLELTADLAASRALQRAAVALNYSDTDKLGVLSLRNDKQAGRYLTAKYKIDLFGDKDPVNDAGSVYILMYRKRSF